MLVLIGAATGAAYGVRLAGKRGGNRLDKLQYAAGFGIAAAIVSMVLAIGLDRYAL